MTNVKNIGVVISELRKTKGVTQDALAKYVGVSAQAVSKWENGGVPDAELLPKIADYFAISIDALFNRECNNSLSTEETILRDITNTKETERVKRAFELCWIMQQSMYGKLFSDSERFEEEAGTFDENDQVYSQMLTDFGYTEMGLFNRIKYYLLVPDVADKDKAFFEGIDYPKLFKTLSDADVFRTLVYLYKRQKTNSFTEKLLVKELDLTIEKAKHVIKELFDLKLLGRTVAEIDDEIVEVFGFWPRPSFVSMLIFAREMIDIPDNFYVNNHSRRKPYL